MTEPSTFILNGAALLADPSGVLVWPERATLVVADLHFEKASGFARRGIMLPPFDTAATLDRLERAMTRIKPSRVIALGDSFHDQGAAERLGAAEQERIRALTASVDWHWITGNHDPDPPLNWGGVAQLELVDGPLTFRHEAQVGGDAGGGAGEVSGHYHPSARLRLKGRSVRGRCFVTDGSRLILPAFGAFTGGLDVTRPELRQVLATRFDVYLMASDRIWRVPADKLSVASPV
jgi:hypothetical protein